MLDKGKELDWFNSMTIVALLIVAVVGFCAFLIWELTIKNPIVNLKIFRYRGFAISAITMPLVFGAFFASIVLVPLWLQTNMGYTAAEAGTLTAFNGVLAVVFSPIVAKLVGKFDPRALICFGVLWMAGVMLWRSTLAANVSFNQMIPLQMAQGFAMPFFFIPLTGLALGSVKPEETASAAGLINFVRTTAGAFGTSIVTSAWENAGDSSRDASVGTLNGADQILAQMQASGMSAAQALARLDGLVQSQAVMIATNHIFQAIALVLAIAAASIWLAPKPTRVADTSQAH
jgi:DHA2 family multidrug resistance protein